VLNYRATEHERYNDADIIPELRVTESYVKQNGSWLLTAKRFTPCVNGLESRRHDQPVHHR